jgi:hypothetical protein
MTRKMPSSAPPLEFALSQPCPAPQRTASGAPLKLWLIRELAAQHAALERVHRAADRLVEMVRRADSLPPRQ